MFGCFSLGLAFWSEHERDGCNGCGVQALGGHDEVTVAAAGLETMLRDHLNDIFLLSADEYHFNLLFLSSRSSPHLTSVMFNTQLLLCSYQLEISWF